MYLEINRNSEHLLNDEIEIGFDGTIYNRVDLIDQLNLPKDVDDNSIIHSLYKKFGKELFKKLDAIFAIYILDKNKLYIARDNVGVTPLYTYDDGKTIIIGERLKDFNTNSSFKQEIDFDALSTYLASGYVVQPYSIFKNTKKVEPGTCLVINLKNAEKEIFTFWSYESELDKIRIDTNEKTIITNIEKLLHQSIEKRVKVDQNFASTLSGGYDSSLIAALLNSTVDKKIDTFTIGFNEQEINEAKDAKKIAKHIGTNHNEHYFTAKDATTIVPNLCKILDEPFADYGATPTVLMSKIIKSSGFSSMIVGDGGDEVFATADDLSNFKKYQSIPMTLRYGTYKLLKGFGLANFGPKYHKILQILKSKNIPKLIQARMTLFNKVEIDSILLKENKPITIFDTINFTKNVPLVDQITGTYFKTSMVDTELVKSFQITKSVGLSLREPLLDNEVIKYLSTIPQSIKVKNGEKKYLLKQIAHKYIDKKLLDRPKQGFNIPFGQWMKNELKELVYEQTSDKRLNSDQIFNTANIIKLRDDFFKGDDTLKYKLWTIFIFQLWYENIKEQQ